MKIYTIGFTKKSAREFFEALEGVDAQHLADIRLNNTSQLAGFTKKRDLEFFTERLTGLTYVEVPVLAPSKPIFDSYKADDNWDRYESDYIQLLEERRVEETLDLDIFLGGVVLLCTEPTPKWCHRRLAAAYLTEHLFEGAKTIHL